jgi:hypothetical protein
MNAPGPAPWGCPSPPSRRWTPYKRSQSAGAFNSQWHDSSRTSRTASADGAVASIREHGYVIIDELVAPATMALSKPNSTRISKSRPTGPFPSHAQLVQLSLTEDIALSPGAQAQFIHRDELLFDAYPFDYSCEVYCNTLWAMTDCTEEMGATRILPGSHALASDVQFELTDTVRPRCPPIQPA